MTTIGILVGSQSGNSLLVAAAVADRLRDWRIDARIMNDTPAAVTDFAGVQGVLVCTSSHGNGELPDNLSPTYDWLDREQPDLSKLPFAVIALGDTTYAATYCGAGEKMEALLARLGARRVQEMLRIDASVQPFPDDEALAWIEQWVPAMQQRMRR